MQNKMTIDGFDIMTWTSDNVDPPCIAVNVTVADRLFTLSDEDKSSIMELTANWCRLLDEYQITGYGETEFEAIQDLFSKATKVDKNEHQ
jgi:hypothetical protein